MAYRYVKLFVDTFVHTDNGYTQVADIRPGDGFYDTFGALRHIMTVQESGEDKIAQLHLRGQFTSLSLPATSLIRVIVDDDPYMTPTAVESLGVHGNIFAFMPQRKLRAFRHLPPLEKHEGTLYIPEEEDVGRYLSDRLFDVPGIVRTLTTMTFRAF